MGGPPGEAACVGREHHARVLPWGRSPGGPGSCTPRPTAGCPWRPCHRTRGGLRSLHCHAAASSAGLGFPRLSWHPSRFEPSSILHIFPALFSHLSSLGCFFNFFCFSPHLSFLFLCVDIRLLQRLVSIRSTRMITFMSDVQSRSLRMGLLFLHSKHLSGSSKQPPNHLLTEASLQLSQSTLSATGTNSELHL